MGRSGFRRRHWPTPAEPPISRAGEPCDNILVVRTNVAGDFSPYTLRLVNDAAQAAQDPFDVTETLAGFDPQLAEVNFSFKVECRPDFDCKLPMPTARRIFRPAADQLSGQGLWLFSHHPARPPDSAPAAWQGSSEADMGVVLAELIAYVGDHLSYQQDAVATEAYLLTARSRISLRRHALLVDYRVHDGCNARAWMHLTVSAPVFLDRAVTRFYTFAPGMPSSLARQRAGRARCRRHRLRAHAGCHALPRA